LRPPPEREVESFEPIKALRRSRTPGRWGGRGRDGHREHWGWARRGNVRPGRTSGR